MRKVGISVVGVVLDSALVVIVVKVLKVSYFVVADRFCPVRWRWWFVDHVGDIRLAFCGFPHLLTRFTGGS
jgi:hypothetical protein